MKKLIVASKSTMKYAKEYFPEIKNMYMVLAPPIGKLLDRQNTYDEAIAIGGGSVIDAAKVLCKNRVDAYPTTYAGASMTSHAVLWSRSGKITVKTKKPVTHIRQGINWDCDLTDMSEEAKTYSKIDCLCHIMESMISPNATWKSNRICKKALKYYHDRHFMEASLEAGKAIEMTGTNILHGLSYPLTTKYGIPHGKALATILKEAQRIPKVQEML